MEYREYNDAENNVIGRVLAAYPSYVVQSDALIYDWNRKKYVNHILCKGSGNRTYVTVSIKKLQPDGTEKLINTIVHSLVAKALVPNPSNFKRVRHIDGDTNNNVSGNLEWCSAKKPEENFDHTKANYIEFNTDGVVGRVLREYPGYVIERDAQIYSLKTKKYRKTALQDTGYVRVGVMPITGKVRMEYVHTLVAKAYIDNPSNLPQVDHIDTNKSNNCVENLAWVTGSENVSRSYQKTSRVSNTAKPVVQYNLDGTTVVKKHVSIKAAAIVCKLSTYSMSKICNSETGEYDGYIWRCEENNTNTQLDSIARDEVWAKSSKHPKYKISNYARVYSKKTKGYQRYKSFNGYVEVSVDNEYRLLHRLVAQAFLSLPIGITNDSELVVNHKDGNKTNNHLSNLEWVTRKRNSQHAVETGLSKKGKPCIQYTLTGEEIARFSNCALASRETNISHSQICQVCRKEEGTAGGCVWRFA
jgi:HNH endonuclease/NUMOD1 domain